MAPAARAGTTFRPTFRVVFHAGGRNHTPQQGKEGKNHRHPSTRQARCTGRAGEEVGREREGTIAFPSFPFLSSRKQGNTHKEENEIEGHHPPSFTMNQNTTTTMSRPLPR